MMASAAAKARVRVFCARAVVLLLVMGLAPVRAESGPDVDEEIVVTGVAPQKLEFHVAGLLDVSPEGQIARWREPLCTQFVGLTPAFTELLNQRLERLATTVRLSLADAGCQPNVIAFFSNEVDVTTETVFNHFDVSLRPAGQVRVQQFRYSEMPVRWIATVNPCGFGCTLANSRITASSAPSITRMLLVIDVLGIQGRDFKAIADYIAFTVMTNPAPNGSRTLESIMGLFDSSAAASDTSGLSVYDEAYFDALYSIPMDRFAEQQRATLTARMLTRLEEQ